MAEPPHHDDTPTSDAAHAPGSARRTHHRLALILLVKLGMVALLLALPAGLAISIGAAHAAVLLLILAAGAAALVIRRRRGSRRNQDRHLDHRTDTDLPRHVPQKGRPVLTAQAHIRTETPSRYLVQLCRHANSVHQKVLNRSDERERPQLQHVEWSETDGTLILRAGRCTLHAGTGILTVRADATNEANLRQIQELVTRNLERFGRRDHLRVDWQRPDAPTVAAGEVG